MGIIFDLDGTLLNTINDIARVTNFALVKNGFPVHDKSSYSGMVGHGLRDLVIQALPEKVSQLDIQNVYDALISEYSQNPVMNTTVYPGIYNLLNKITEMNIPMAILSNKHHEITVKIVSNIFNNLKFISVLGSRNGIPKKPDPHSALEISQTMLVPPENILFVGDSEADIATALACNMRPIGVSWGYRSVEDIRNSGAKVIIHDPLEVLNYL